MISPFPYDKLPRYSASQATLLTTLRRHLGPGTSAHVERWAADCLGLRPNQLELSIGEFWEPPPAQVGERLAHASLLGLSGPGDIRIVLALDPQLLVAICRLVLRAPREYGSIMPSAGEQGLASCCLAWLLSYLPTGGLWTVVDVVPTAAAAMVYLAEFAVRLGENAGLLWLGTSSPLPLVNGSAVPSTDRSSPYRRIAHVSWQCGVELFRITLPVQDLKEIAAGDIIVAPGCPQPGDLRSASVRVGKGRFPAEPCEHGVRITGPFRRGEGPMIPADNEQPEVEGTATLIEQLEVEMLVEMGRLELTAQQLMELGVGDVVSLRKPLRATLDLRVGNRLVGRGELVSVGDEAGIRVTEVYD